MKAVYAQIGCLLFCILLAFYAFFIITPSVEAATGINKQINFQGKVVNTNGTNVSNNSYTFVFKLYSVSSGGAAIWTESKSITVTDGVFRTSLGDVTALPGSIDFNTDNIYLGVEFNSDGEMDPRIRFTAVPYAFNALKVAGLTVTDTTGTFTLTAGKTLSVANTLSFAGTDGTTITFQGTDTYVGLATTDVLINKTIGSTGLIFSGATTDIDTAAAEGLVLQGRAASSFNTTSGAISFQAAGTGTVSTVQIGAGGSGSTTPDYLGLDVKSDTGDPAGGFEGAMYYNTADNVFRCYQNTGWTNCIGGAGSSAWDDITTPTDNLTLSMAAYNTALTWDPTANSAEAAFIMNFDGEDSAGDEDQTLLTLNQSSNGTDVTEAADALLTFANSDANDPVENAIRFDAGAAGTDFTYGINFDLASIGTAELVLQNGETIDNVVDGVIALTGNADVSGTLTSGTADAFTVNATGNISTSGTTGLTFTATGGIVLAGGTLTDGTDGVDVADDFEVSGTTTLAGILDVNGGDGSDFAGAVTFNDDVTLTLAGTENLAIAATTSTITTGVIDLDVDTSVTGGFSVINNSLTVNDGAASDDDYYAYDITLTNNDANANAFGMRILGAATTNAGANAYQAGLIIDNQEDFAGSMASAIQILATTDTATAIALDVDDAEIVTALSAGANDLTGTSWGIAGATGIGTFAGGVFNGNVNMTDDLLLNIGHANTDFTSGGGLALAGDLEVNGDDLISDGTSLKIEVGGTSTIAIVQIGQGGAGSATPDFLGLDVKSDTGDPAGGFEGAMYYNTSDNVFRCYQNTGWTNCIGSGGVTTLQQAYDATTPTILTDASGDFIIQTIGGATDTQFEINAASAPEIDMVNLTNSGFGTTVNGVDGLAIDFTAATDGAGDTNAASHITFTDSGDSGDTISGLQITAGTAAAGTQYGISIDNITGGGGTEYALSIGTGWDRGLSVASASTFTSTLTSEGILTVGSGGNTFTFDPATGPLLAGNARTTRKVTLVPEFEGATLTPDGAANTGTMTSDFCYDGGAGGSEIPDRNITVCDAGQRHNYYYWTSTGANDYDIWLNWQVPDDFSEFAANPAVKFYGRKDASGDALTMTLFDDTKTVCGSATALSVNSAWTNTNYADVSGCDGASGGNIIAGDIVTIRIQMAAAANGNDVYMGEIEINYVGKY